MPPWEPDLENKIILFFSILQLTTLQFKCENGIFADFYTPGERGGYRNMLKLQRNYANFKYTDIYLIFLKPIKAKKKM